MGKILFLNMFSERGIRLNSLNNIMERDNKGMGINYVFSNLKCEKKVIDFGIKTF